MLMDYKHDSNPYQCCGEFCEQIIQKKPNISPLLLDRLLLSASGLDGNRSGKVVEGFQWRNLGFCKEKFSQHEEGVEDKVSVQNDKLEESVVFQDLPRARIQSVMPNRTLYFVRIERQGQAQALGEEIQ
ncbi:hypothetical protein SUGI_0431650 [Cryptomeria japonica]|nr:hypothetical protein SUGI_0431650 [Cryptomeria japonica]